MHNVLAMPLTDGRYLVLFSPVWPTGVLMLLNPDDGTLSLASDPCGEDVMVATDRGELLGATPAFFEPMDGGGYQLARVELDE